MSIFKVGAIDLNRPRAAGLIYGAQRRGYTLVPNGEDSAERDAANKVVARVD
jgi:hypothetical protein